MKNDPFHGHGGRYVIRDGKRERVEDPAPPEKTDVRPRAPAEEPAPAAQRQRKTAATD